MGALCQDDHARPSLRFFLPTQYLIRAISTLAVIPRYRGEIARKDALDCPAGLAHGLLQYLIELFG